jgi:hypothetical protein
LRRVYHDLVLVGRVSAQPLAGTDAIIVARAVEEGRAFLNGIGTSLARREPPPATDALNDALRALAEHVETARGANGDDASRRAVLDFALEQFQRDIGDLAARAQEFARPQGQG